VAALAKLKSNIDSGIFFGIQFAGVPLKWPTGYLKSMCALYQQADIFNGGAYDLGCRP